ncbi:hypothetical protein OF83DRAFT_1111562 [Amylostereum chailletii]|nr:hypothetical protein OF83DRAFT_1111562 [Amylostereum chailletii]
MCHWRRSINTFRLPRPLSTRLPSSTSSLSTRSSIPNLSLPLVRPSASQQLPIFFSSPVRPNSSGKRRRCPSGDASFHQ